MLALAFLTAAFAQDVSLRAPTAATAGMGASIATGGNGPATFYLVGPDDSTKRAVELGQDVAISPRELESAGRYLAVLCTSDCKSADFFVAPARPANLTVLVHPSRVPVEQDDAISAVAISFDRFGNLVTAPAGIAFELNARGSPLPSHRVKTEDGVAWFRTNSGKAAGTLQVAASIDDVTTRRVVQAVASEPCNLRIQGQRTAKGIMVETDPVRDCSGNAVPDGTVVTFTARGGTEVSTVDAPVKQDVARALILANGAVVISAASGVVMGNELRMGEP